MMNPPKDIYVFFIKCLLIYYVAIFYVTHRANIH